MSVRIIHGECRDVLQTLPECSVDAIVTDPPYGLTNTKGGTGAASINLSNPAGRARIGTEGNGGGNRGFMGQKWDGTGVAFDPETWRQALRVLKPGGMLVAFGGTRTYHRMACAIEDAGFEVRDMLAWLYGSGFPKGTDKAKIPEAWRGWNTALKPAHEPICLARKAMDGTLAANLAKWGTGALWVDGCRVLVDGEEREAITGRGALPARHNVDEARAPGVVAQAHELGRWPANVLHDGSDEVLAGFPQAGAASPVRGTEASMASVGVITGERDRVPGAFHADTGSAARFFYCAKASRSERNEGLLDLPERPMLWSSGEQSPGTFQSPNTNRAAQNNHPTVKPVALMRWLIRLVTPPGGTLLDPFAGSGTTLKAAELDGYEAIGIELEPAYIDIARRRIGADAPMFASVTTEVA